MPKHVDPEARRRLVVDALFRVVVRDGLQRTSLRAVAAEAELNIGSLRHYFASQHDLMHFAMQSMLDRVGGRLLDRIERIGDLSRYPRTEQLRLTADLLAELLPLDDSRRAEVTVFLDFNTATRTNPAFHELSHRAAEGSRRLVRRVLTRLDATGTLRPGLDLAVETERLTALLDGLGLSAVLHPELLAPHTCVDALITHLGGLSLPSEAPSTEAPSGAR
ncbi:TetR family transcriptional regulator C-terminal domain-containing protein [Streptomyces sp. BHT-5-2]|uniref:TetR/AcrR family transcriptional regulator n=1 Tax=unclassified Streptomyces TaxID=2593676 RepID=UPI001C8E2BF6|nr:TetR family transcriptional regulator C-terminal domain-containing protein [Streptomyces sp. BHT-5-2]QZL05061.1 TetR family transcriptional regulator C-terminal domain-containing protein [Streptomyces sp. BHT-5-2]